MVPPENPLDARSESHAHLVELLDQVPNAVLLVGESGRVLGANRPAEVLFGYPQDGLAGIAVEDLLPDRLAEKHRRHRAAYGRDPVERVMGVDRELRARRRDGSEFLAEVVLRPWTTGTGVVVVASVADVTRRHALARQAGAAERRLRRILDGLFGFVGLVTLDGYLIEANAAPLEAAGLTRDEVLGRPLWETYWWSHSADVQAQVRDAIGRAARGETVRYEVPVRVRDDALIVIDVVFSPILGEDGAVEHVLGFAVDVTQRVEAEERLRSSEARLKLVFENTTDMQCLYRVAEDGRLILEAANPAYLASVHAAGLPSDVITVGVERTELLRALGLREEQYAAETKRIRRALATGVPESSIEAIWSSAGILQLETSLVPVTGQDGTRHFLWSGRDITERRAAEQAVEDSLREKEVLLREMHHRVKNNLQVISSLVELQARRVSEPGLRELLAQTSARVRSMALVHERLYESDDFARADFGRYLRALVKSIEGSHLAPNGGVTLKLDVEPVVMGVDTAVPCGLIVNELVSNALAHAFPDGKGVVVVRLRSEGTEIVLEVQDDGVGMDAALVDEGGGALGLTIVRTLAEQVGGRLEVDVSDEGTCSRIRCTGARDL